MLEAETGRPPLSQQYFWEGFREGGRHLVAQAQGY